MWAGIQTPCGCYVVSMKTTKGSGPSHGGEKVSPEVAGALVGGVSGGDFSCDLGWCGTCRCRDCLRYRSTCRDSRWCCSWHRSRQCSWLGGREAGGQARSGLAQKGEGAQLGGVRPFAGAGLALPHLKAAERSFRVAGYLVPATKPPKSGRGVMDTPYHGLGASRSYNILYSCFGDC